MGILKLNLLPAYLAERRKTLGMMKFMGIVVLAVVGASVAWAGKAKADVASATRSLAEATAKANEVLKIEQEEATVKGQQPAYAAWVTWYDLVNKQGEHMASSLEAINQWLFKDIEITQLAVRGNALQFDGRARNLEAMKTFYLQMKLAGFGPAALYTGPPQVQYSIDGWTVARPPDDSKPLPFKVQGTLKDQYALVMPGIPQRTISLSGGRGGATSQGDAGGTGGPLRPRGASAGAGPGGGNVGEPQSSGGLGN